MNANTANVPTSNNPISVQNDVQSIIQNPVSELEQLKNCSKSESVGVGWKLEAGWAFQMFALYHLNSSYWLCQEWIAVAQSWAERNLCYCVIFPLQTNQTEVFFFFFCKQISKSKTSAPVSHTDRGHWRGKKRKEKRKNQTKSSAVSKHQSVRPAPILSVPK